MEKTQIDAATMATLFDEFIAFSCQELEDTLDRNFQMSDSDLDNLGEAAKEEFCNENSEFKLFRAVYTICWPLISPEKDEIVDELVKYASTLNP